MRMGIGEMYDAPVDNVVGVLKQLEDVASKKSE